MYIMETNKNLHILKGEYKMENQEKVVNMNGTTEETVENTAEETKVETTSKSTNVIVEAEPKFYQKAWCGIKKHGKKIAVAVGVTALGVAAYALGKKAGSDDDYDYDYDSISYSFGGSDDSDVVADADYTVTDDSGSTEE